MSRESIIPDKVPVSVAIIMDGNGRWAQERGLPRSQGHIAGVKSVRSITEAACRIGVKYLTLYAFSTENWGRPQEEVNALMGLLVQCLHNEMPLFMENGIRLRFIGQRDVFSPEVKDAMQHAQEMTASNQRMELVLALSYSSRWEITEMAKSLCRKAVSRELDPDAITADTVSESMQTCFMPDPDLLIRTSGEYRISNFLLWQIAYSELYFSKVYWPDFDENCFYEAILDYQRRERRFGKVLPPNHVN